MSNRTVIKCVIKNGPSYSNKNGQTAATHISIDLAKCTVERRKPSALQCLLYDGTESAGLVFTCTLKVCCGVSCSVGGIKFSWFIVWFQTSISSSRYCLAVLQIIDSTILKSSAIIVYFS